MMIHTDTSSKHMLPLAMAIHWSATPLLWSTTVTILTMLLVSDSLLRSLFGGHVEFTVFANGVPIVIQVYL